MGTLVRRIVAETSGQDLAEYALLLVLLALVVAAALPGFAGALIDTFATLASSLFGPTKCCD